jgi:hypothetical protein
MTLTKAYTIAVNSLTFMLCRSGSVVGILGFLCSAADMHLAVLRVNHTIPGNE